MGEKIVMIDGVEYVPKAEVEQMEVKGEYVIVRTEKAGVHAGLKGVRNGDEIELFQARRIWHWDGAASLSELAVHGTNKPENCKFPTAVASVLLLGVIEVISCTKKAEESIKGVEIWTSSAK